MKSLRILLEDSCCNELKATFIPSEYFIVVDNPNNADVIIFQNHSYAYIKQSRYYQNYKKKCIVLTETDKPNYFLPGVYASGYNHLLSKGRIKTYCYFYTNRNTLKKNQFIDEYKNKRLKEKYLFSFIGGSTSWVRKRLFKLYKHQVDDNFLIQSSDDYNHWDSNVTTLLSKRDKQESYVKNVKESLFYLCPRGAGHGSIRLFEVMELGISPVIISDNWILPEGPDWKEFAVFIKEKDISKIRTILKALSHEASDRGIKAQKAYNLYFSEKIHAERLYYMISDLLVERKWWKEEIISFIFPLIDWWQILIEKSKPYLKKIILP